MLTHIDLFDSQCVTSCLCVLQNLECGLLQKERQSAQVRRAHLQNVESLCALHDKRLNLVQEPWENCMEHISSKLNSQRSV